MKTLLKKGAKEAEAAMEMMMDDSALVAANDGSIGTIFVPDNAESYKNANSVNWNYIKTLGLSYADMIVEGGIGALKIPSKMNIAFSAIEKQGYFEIKNPTVICPDGTSTEIKVTFLIKKIGD